MDGLLAVGFVIDGLLISVGAFSGYSHDGLSSLGAFSEVGFGIDGLLADGELFGVLNDGP